MLLNAILTPYTWLMAGAILGISEARVPAAPEKWRRRVVIGQRNPDRSGAVPSGRISASR
jgi:hypothetical protein